MGGRLQMPDRRRRGELGIRQVEPQGGRDRQLQAVAAALGGHAGRFAQLEDVAREGRLRRDPHTDRRRLTHGVELRLLARQPLGLASAPRQFLDDILRRARQCRGPVLRQEVDVDPLAGIDLIDAQLAGERDPQRAAVGIATRSANPVGGAGHDPVDGDIDRAGKADHENIARGTNLGADRFRKSQQDAGIAAGDIERSLALHGRRRLCGGGQRHRQHQHRDQQGSQRQQDARPPCRRGPRPPQVLAHAERFQRTLGTEHTRTLTRDLRNPRAAGLKAA